MSTEQADAEAEARRDHVRAVSVTSIAALAGIGAALLSSWMTSGMAPAEAATQDNPLFATLMIVLILPFVLQVLGLKKEDFGAKDWLFVGFMVFSMWFVTWGIMLMTSVSL